MARTVHTAIDQLVNSAKAAPSMANLDLSSSDLHSIDYSSVAGKSAELEQQTKIQKIERQLEKEKLKLLHMRKAKYTSEKTTGPFVVELARSGAVADPRPLKVSVTTDKLKTDKSPRKDVGPVSSNTPLGPDSIAVPQTLTSSLVGTTSLHPIHTPTSTPRPSSPLISRREPELAAPTSIPSPVHSPPPRARTSRTSLVKSPLKPKTQKVVKSDDS